MCYISVFAGFGKRYHGLHSDCAFQGPRHPIPGQAATSRNVLVHVVLLEVLSSGHFNFTANDGRDP